VDSQGFYAPAPSTGAFLGDDLAWRTGRDQLRTNQSVITYNSLTVAVSGRAFPCWNAAGWSSKQYSLLNLRRYQCNHLHFKNTQKIYVTQGDIQTIV
jgi:hypothetical protein